MGKPEILRYPTECQAIYINGSSVRMPSRILEIANQVRAAVEAGKTVFIGCASDREIRRFKEQLGDIDPAKLRLFVETYPRMPTS